MLLTIIFFFNSKVAAEWRSYAVTDVAEIARKSKGDVLMFWNEVMALEDASGMKKFESLGSLVRCCLSLAHGNADTERSFSDVAKILTKYRSSMGCDTLNALLIAKSHMKITETHADEFNVTQQMLTSARSARSKSHNAKLDELRRAKQREKAESEKRMMEAMKKKIEEEEEKQKVEERERECSKMKSDAEELRNHAQSLMADATSAFKKAESLDKSSGKLHKKVVKAKEKAVKSQLKRMASAMSDDSTQEVKRKKIDIDKGGHNSSIKSFFSSLTKTTGKFKEIICLFCLISKGHG